MHWTSDRPGHILRANVRQDVPTRTTRSKRDAPGDDRAGAGTLLEVNFLRFRFSLMHLLAAWPALSRFPTEEGRRGVEPVHCLLVAFHRPDAFASLLANEFGNLGPSSSHEVRLPRTSPVFRSVPERCPSLYHKLSQNEANRL